MLSFFRSNNPGVVIFYIAYILLFRACFFFISSNEAIPYQVDEPLSKILFQLLRSVPLDYTAISITLSCILCFVQAILVNLIINENRILPRKNYLSGVLFITVASWFKESLFLTSSSLALTCLLIFTWRLFSVLKKDKPYARVFDTGFWVAIASLFYFPAILFTVAVFVGLSMLRPFSYREWVIAVLGLAAPFFLVFTFYYWNDSTAVLLQYVFNFTKAVWFESRVLLPIEWMLVGGLLLLSVSCVIFLPSVVYSSIIQVRKFSGILVVLTVLSGISFLLQQEFSLGHFVLFSLPVSILLSMLMMYLKSTMISEVIHIILILLVLAGQFIPLFNFK